MERLIKTEQDRASLQKFIAGRDLPFTVSITKRRTLKQNNLDWFLYAQIAKHAGDESVDYYRGLCKLEIGVPILRAENPEFRAAYNKTLLKMSYEQKLILMREPINFPVTRLMTTAQQKKYIDEIVQVYSGRGFALDLPA